MIRDLTIHLRNHFVHVEATLTDGSRAEAVMTIENGVRNWSAEMVEARHEELFARICDSALAGLMGGVMAGEKGPASGLAGQNPAG